LPNLLLNSLRNPAPLIVFDSDLLAIPAQAPRLWPEPVELKVSRDLAPESAAAPFRRGPARDQFSVGQGLGIRAGTSTRRRNLRRRARALAKRPAGRVFSAGLAGRTEKPGRLIWLPVEAAPLCSVSNFRVSSFPAAILPVPFSPVPQAPDRRKVLVGARASTLPKQLDLEMTLTKMIPTKRMRKVIQTADSTLEQGVWHGFRLWRNASPSWPQERRAARLNQRRERRLERSLEQAPQSLLVAKKRIRRPLPARVLRSWPRRA